jgi:putative DNA methylase
VFFENGLETAFAHIREAQHPDYPLTIYYAFKQTEESDEVDIDANNNNLGISSTGWETMLEAVIRTGFEVNRTWPVRTERPGGVRNVGRNSLASSIVLVCRPRPEDAKNTTRLQFIRALRRELPEALRKLQHGNIAPVDLAQAAIGPGMAVFSRYKAVLEADGTLMRVRTALQLINQALDEVLAEQEGEYDSDTRWAIAWFDQHGMDEGPFGTAETLSKAKNTSVRGMEDVGVVLAKSGKVRLLKRDELPEDWDPADDRRLTAWEITQHLVRALDQHGEQGAADLLARIPSDLAETARDLAYRLYTTCERKKWAQEALAYNSLVVAWPEIARLAAERARGGPVQGRMFG